MGKKRNWTDLDFIIAVKESKSYADVIRKLGLKTSGSSYDTVKKKIKELNLSITHFIGSAWNVGLKFKPIKPRDLSEVLVKNSTWKNTNHLKQRLLKENIKEYKCEICGRSEWLGKPIALELHHINGIKNDLRIENLLILCPNCHAFTDNYRGKNSKKVMSAQKETFDVEVG